MIAITGISGFVGGNLARTLISEGRAVRGLIRHDRRAVEGLDLDLVEGNLQDFGSLKRAFEGVDVVYHLAASISLDGDWSQMEATNIFGTRNVVEACLACEVRRLVHCSSIHAFKQVLLNAPLDEARAMALSPHNPAYDRSKAVAELEVQKGIVKGLDAVIVNPTAIAGPFDFKPSFLGKAILAMGRGQLPALVDRARSAESATGDSSDAAHLTAAIHVLAGAQARPADEHVPGGEIRGGHGGRLIEG